MEKLKQDEFISFIWEVLNILFIVLLKKKGKMFLKKKINHL